MRIFWIKVFFLIFFAAILARLYFWQIIKADYLQAQAEGQHFTDIKVQAKRGNIYFSDGSILASSNPSFLLFGQPKILTKEQKTNTGYMLAKILAEEDESVGDLAKDFINKLSSDLFWIPLKKQISFETKKEIEDLSLTGIGFETSSSRFYPEGSSSAHILGFVGSDTKGDSKGYFGVEGYFDGELRGVSGLLRHEKDALGLPILIGNFLNSEAKNGKDLTLNLDRSIQFIVEQKLKEGLEKYGAKAASAVVMDPKSGAILALASYPNYDPLQFFNFPKEYYKNPIVADQFEPGSTFKVLVMSAALNEDKVAPDTKCDICGGPIQLGGFSIRTWNNKYYPDTTMKDVIIHSDNTGMVFTGQKLGLDKFYEYLENFGLGSQTGIDLQDESSPDLRAKGSWREIDLATASFGQGIAVTAIQMVRAVSAIANGGYLMEPHIVKEIRDEKQSFEIKPKIIRQVVKEGTAKIMTEMMVAAIEEGEAKWTKLKGFKVAGKTGTAQIPVAGHYDPNKTIASFVGFAPADDPKFVMLVRFDQPSASIFGAETAAPTFFEIARELFSYYKIAPTE
ncbi:MAG: cell division protein FtsI (penicillin-binding protein 3) [Microgenomates group bacterium Gr01-1014_7]|nr:MAG: cell division protein FtsI (penicillin-binding protein 3) [Microgenomates group bacterium Gr01-1014_7]